MRRAFFPHADRTDMPSTLKALSEKDIVPNAIAEFIDELQDLRNRVGHAVVHPSVRSADAYRDLCRLAVFTLESLADLHTSYHRHPKSQ
jgi:hypothetical protein